MQTGGQRIASRERVLAYLVQLVRETGLVVGGDGLQGGTLVEGVRSYFRSIGAEVAVEVHRLQCGTLFEGGLTDLAACVGRDGDFLDGF